MRVHDDVRDDPLIAKGHVFLRYDQTTHTLLTMARGELVAKFGLSGLASEDFDEGAVLPLSKHDLVDADGLWELVRDRR